MSCIHEWREYKNNYKKYKKNKHNKIQASEVIEMYGLQKEVLSYLITNDWEYLCVHKQSSIPLLKSLFQVIDYSVFQHLNWWCTNVIKKS